MKKILGVYSAPEIHWVGNGFPARTLFSYDSFEAYLSPFLHLDYAGPTEFSPSENRRGVGAHPHRGFETVTIVYQGEVDHRDSCGNGGRIGPGDVQWMTAASGILHEEYHSERFSRSGGMLEIAQLWVNLPARHKMDPPGYQTILDGDIPAVALPGGVGKVRVIAGDYQGKVGPARTFTPMDVWDVRLPSGQSTILPAAENRNAVFAVLHGPVRVNGSETVLETQWALLDRAGRDVAIEAVGDATLLFLSGEAIDEPVAGYGPFVMNSAEEIKQAIEDYQSGRFGRIPG